MSDTLARADQNAQRIPVVLIAAVAENGVIGSANRLPWRLRSDMQRFRSLTMGHPVVMGRKTFQSLFKPLNGRTTIVVTRDRAFSAPGVVVATSLKAALAAARGDALRRGADAVMVAGGAEIYAQAMPLAERLIITLVHDRPKGDAVFPSVDSSVWRERERAEHAAGVDDSASYAYVQCDRIETAESIPSGEPVTG